MKGWRDCGWTRERCAHHDHVPFARGDLLRLASAAPEWRQSIGLGEMIFYAWGSRVSRAYPPGK